MSHSPSSYPNSLTIPSLSLQKLLKCGCSMFLFSALFLFYIIPHSISSIFYLPDMMNWSSASIPISLQEPFHRDWKGKDSQTPLQQGFWLDIRFHPSDVLQWDIWKTQVKQGLVSYHFGSLLLASRVVEPWGFPIVGSLCGVTDTMVAGEL